MTKQDHTFIKENRLTKSIELLAEEIGSTIYQVSKYMRAEGIYPTKKERYAKKVANSKPTRNSKGSYRHLKLKDRPWNWDALA